MYRVARVIAEVIDPPRNRRAREEAGEERAWMAGASKMMNLAKDRLSHKAAACWAASGRFTSSGL